MKFYFNKQALLALFSLFMASPFFSKVLLTPFEEKAMKDISYFRLHLNTQETCKDAVDLIDEYQTKINLELKDKVSDEILLSMNNILVWEKYNYLYEEDIDCPLLEPLIKEQYETVKKFFKSHKKEEHNKWLYATSGDILSCCMQFLPLSTAINEGLTIKKYYDDALDQDPDFVWSLINIAQWYFYAPKINGGGKGKARKALEHSVKVSSNEAESFYSKELLSQVEFERKNFNLSTNLLNQADTLLPGSRSVAHYRKINSIGHSYFDYTVHRRKIDRKILRLEGKVLEDDEIEDSRIDEVDALRAET